MRLTIVTPTLNRGPLLAEAIESVLRQQDADVEHIVVDGMSTDDTVEVLARYPHLRVIREPDTGLWDALNKGIRAATGDAIGHLNSDDAYPPETFAAVREAWRDDVDIVSGGAKILAAGEHVKHRFVARAEVALTFENVTLGALIPNARFVRRALYERVGLYDLGYRVAADRDFFFRALLAQARSVEIERVLYQYRWHDDSLTFSGNPAQEARWRDEYLRLAEHFLAADLPPDARSAARRWHLRESAQAATRTLLAWRWSRAGDYARRGVRQNAAWPVMFMRHLAGALLRP